ncbi:MAG: GHKL domain-containing protein [Clostridiales bacterium]|nr:GHKL domain-containing protein [Clostridiales bacterium]
MVLDTKWKKYKYSNGNKLLCVLLALLMVACLMLNVVQLVRFVPFYGEDIFKEETTSFYDTDPFRQIMDQTVESIEHDLTYDARVAEMDKYFDAFYAEYLKGAEESRIDSKEVQELLPDDADDYFYYDYETAYDYYCGQRNTVGQLTDGRYFYCGDDGYFYTKYMLYDKSIVNAEDSDKGINFGHSEDAVREWVASEYYSQNPTRDPDYYYHGYDYSALKNILYYGVNTDGKVITNVTTNREAFVQSVKNGEGDSIAFEPAGRGYYTSDSLENTVFYGFNSSCNDFSLYIQMNSEFSEEDSCRDVYNNYCEAENINFNTVCINIVISVVALILLAVVSCRIAGHKDGELSMAKLDKMPFDLHFALMGTAVAFSVIGVALLVAEHSYLFEHGGWLSNYRGVEERFYSSSWCVAAICAASMLIWLMVLSFATSLSRAIKAGYPVFSKLLIVKLLVLIFKGLKWFVLGAFKVIGKVLNGIARALGSYAFRPKRLHKRSVPAVVLYTLFNLVSLGIIILLFASWDGFANFCGFLGSIVVLGADGYLVYKAVKYMKSLDDIISASEKGEPLPYNTDTLPQSLKILADSLESTNAQLQKAVVKAVKDERTKTELITNVSHDLKTPLTSVINYIDLLQKCDIEDEDAKKYMAVIAEKSNKLKRLIEDLIEASKVSTGNVTINKTLLNLNELATQAIVEETADIEKNNLQIIFEEPADKHIVMADGTKIYRVFENLLSNARKYSAPGSRIYARVYSDMRYGYFEIKNISKEQLNITADELTERFVRGDQSRSQDGNGLGLSIAKELCRLNNGELIITIDGDLFKATVKLPKQ